ncbi:MAG: phosphoribosylamine--glycine ligase, partial [Acidobacteriota bacterium]|nr:phosphoribosylamine--glycine ligase [Acidobacteriota bacterium]
IVDIFEAAIQGTAGGLDLRMLPGASACVIAASAGYPGRYTAGQPIAGLEGVVEGTSLAVFHSGTAERGSECVTAGGRVLGVAAAAADLRTALDEAYAALAGIHFDGMLYRRDIGWRALRPQP